MSIAYNFSSQERSNIIGIRCNGWSEEAKEIVRSMWVDDHCSLSEIGFRFGKTRSAAAGIISRLGLKGTGGQQPRKANPDRKRTYNNERRRELRVLRVAAGRTEYANRLPPDDLRQFEHQDDPSIGVSLLDLQQDQCRFVRGDSRDAKPFCGQPVIRRDDGTTSSYCGFHHRLVYRPRP